MTLITGEEPNAASAAAAPTKITLTGAQETLLATLYGRAQDAASDQPLLGDNWAGQMVEKVDYDFSKLGMSATMSASVAIRARLLDKWTAEFLQANPSATVLHLACGLDSRCLRIPHSREVRWIDIDLPDVVALRQTLSPVPDGDYTLLAASAAEPSEWIDKIPVDRPTIVIMEGLTMYLRKEEGQRLFEALVGQRLRPVGGQVIFDAYGTVGIKLQGFVKPVASTGAVLHWGIDDPKLLQEWCPELEVMDDLRATGMPGIDNLTWAAKMQMGIVSMIPYLRDAGRMFRLHF